MEVSVEEEEAGQWALKCKAVSPRLAFRILRLEVLDAAIQLVLSRVSRVRLSVVQWTAAHQAPCPGDSPGKNTGVGFHALPSKGSS